MSCVVRLSRPLVQVVAQGERSLSLSLGSKGLHLTLADRATKEFLWEHLRKMREQAREQAKASLLTRTSSIDRINMDGYGYGVMLKEWGSVASGWNQGNEVGWSSVDIALVGTTVLFRIITG